MKRQRNFKYVSKKVCSVALALALSTSLAPAPSFVTTAGEAVGVEDSSSTILSDVEVKEPSVSYDFTSGEAGDAVLTGTGASIAAGTGVTLTGNTTTAEKQFTWWSESVDNASLTVPGIKTSSPTAISIQVDYQREEDFVNYSGLFQLGTTVAGSVTEGDAVFGVNETGELRGNCDGGTWVDYAGSGVSAKKGEDAQTIIVFNGNGEYAAYLNGSKVVSGTYTAAVNQKFIDVICSKGIIFGGNSANPSNDGLPKAFNGTISSVKMYDYAVTDEQAKEIYKEKAGIIKVSDVNVSLKDSEIFAPQGTTNVQYTVVPSNVTEKYTVEYSSSDPAVATVDDKGVISAVAGGKTNITVKVTPESGAPIEKSVELTVTNKADRKMLSPKTFYSFDGNLKNEVNGAEATLTGSLMQEEATATAADVIFTDVVGASKKAVKLTGAGSYGILLDKDAAPTGTKYTISYKVRVNESTQYAPQVLLANVKTEGEPDDIDESGTFVNANGDAIQPFIRVALGRGNSGKEGTYMSWAFDVSDKAGVDSAGEVQPNDEWATFTTVYNNENVTIYKDGVKVSSSSNNTFINDGTTAVYLGVNKWDTPFNGEICDFAIYDEALDADDVSAFYSLSRAKELLSDQDYAKKAYTAPAGGWNDYFTKLQTSVNAAEAVQKNANGKQSDFNAALTEIPETLSQLSVASCNVSNTVGAHVTVSDIPATVSYGNAISFTATAEQGYTTKVTYKVGNGESKEIQGSDEGVFKIPDTDVTGDIAIDVQAVPRTYTITYYIADGDSAPVKVTDDAQLNAVSSFTVESEDIVLPKPTEKEGKEFVGWFTSRTFATEITSIPTGTKKNMSVYGKWEAKATPTPSPTPTPSQDVAVTAVKLNQTAASVNVGKTVSLTATVTPNNATNNTVTWKSSDPSVATVANGVVKGIKAGTATITATAGGKTAQCVITVKAAETAKKSSFKVTKITNKAKGSKVVSVKTSQKNIKAKKGSVIKITVKEENIGKAIKATVSDKKIITVKTSKKKAGKVTVTLTVKKKTKKNVKVTIKCGSKTITKTIKVVKK